MPTLPEVEQQARDFLRQTTNISEGARPDVSGLGEIPAPGPAVDTRRRVREDLGPEPFTSEEVEAQARFFLRGLKARQGRPVLAPGLEPEVDEPNRLFGEFARGIKAGVQQVGTDYRGARAVLAQAAGDDATVAELIDVIQQREERVERELPRTVKKFEDIDSLESFTRYAARALGETLPHMGFVIAGGGVTGVLGRLVAKRLITRQVAAQLAARLPKVAAGGGAIATAAGLATGSTAIEQVEAIGRIDPPVAITAGMIQGS